MSVKSFILVFHQSSPEHELFIHSVATMLGTSVKSNATQYNSSAINYIFATIIISFDNQRGINLPICLLLSL